MHRVGIFAAILVCCMSGRDSAAGGKQSSTEAYLEHLHSQGRERVIVKFKDQIDTGIFSRYNAQDIRISETANAVVCELSLPNIGSLKQHKSIEYIIPDTIVVVAPVPEEPLDETEILGYEGDVTVRWNNLEAGVNSHGAWNRHYMDGTGVKIAIIDSGINYTMENLDGNYLGGHDFMGLGDDDPINDDPLERHGTYVASVLLGEGVDKVVGVAYNSSYYALRIMDKSDEFFVSNAILAMEWAMAPAHKADIISMSIGAPVDLEPGLREAWRTTCNAAYDAGIILVAGSGNEATSYSAYPAAFNNVISVGGSAEDQTLYSSSNGGVDVVAPGYKVYTVRPDNSAWLVNGTSMATPHVSGIAALLLQYARNKNLEINNGYFYEALKHSAVHMPLIMDPDYLGAGKARAARSDTNDPNGGALDLVSSNWPVDCKFGFSGYAFKDANYPVYQVGADVNQSITLTNITDALGNTAEDIENLEITVSHVYYGQPNEPNLPGDSVRIFPTVTLLEPNDANSITVSWLYTVPAETTPGLKKTTLELEFNFAGNSRVMRIGHNEPNSFWYAAIPGDIDLEDDVDLADFGMLASMWEESNCGEPNWCERADIDQSGDVGWGDVGILADNWLRTAE